MSLSDLSPTSVLDAPKAAPSKPARFRYDRKRADRYWNEVLLRMPGVSLSCSGGQCTLCIKNPGGAFNYDALRRDPLVKEDDRGYRNPSMKAHVRVFRAQPSCLYVDGTKEELQRLTYMNRTIECMTGGD